tara:strand:+ start:124221 stop:124856 length:636 start_codon:yes stop_codon:yes gene_type:complete
MSARENILRRLRAAQPSPSIKPTQDSDIEIEKEALIAQFILNAEKEHAEVIDIRSSTLEEQIIKICEQKNIKHLMLPPEDFPMLKSWQGGPSITRFNQPIEVLKNALFNTIDAGITGADCAIAETGTLIQSDAIRTPRTLSLVPPIHICVLDVNQIYSTMQAVLSAMKMDSILPTNLIFITGPSKTSDIQQTLAYGAHGPRELIILIKDEK